MLRDIKGKYPHGVIFWYITGQIISPADNLHSLWYFYTYICALIHLYTGGIITVALATWIISQYYAHNFGYYLALRCWIANSVPPGVLTRAQQLCILRFIRSEPPLFSARTSTHIAPKSVKSPRCRTQQWVREWARNHLIAETQKRFGISAWWRIFIILLSIITSTALVSISLSTSDKKDMIQFKYFATIFIKTHK